MKIRIYHELNGTVRIVKVVEQGPEKGKESSMFHNLKPGSMAEVEIDAVLQHQACMKESKSESKEKDDSCNLQKFLQVYAPDMPYITVKKTASKMKISVEDAEKIIAKCKESGLLENMSSVEYTDGEAKEARKSAIEMIEGIEDEALLELMYKYMKRVIDEEKEKKNG